MRYRAKSGHPWQMSSEVFAPLSTIRTYSYACHNDGLLFVINQLLVITIRPHAGLEVSPIAGMIDSRSTKTEQRHQGHGLVGAGDLTFFAYLTLSQLRSS